MSDIEAKILMVVEAPPEDRALADKNTVQAFEYAGIQIKNINDVFNKDVYITTAVKTPRKDSRRRYHECFCSVIMST